MTDTRPTPNGEPTTGYSAEETLDAIRSGLPDTTLRLRHITPLGVPIFQRLPDARATATPGLDVDALRQVLEMTGGRPVKDTKAGWTLLAEDVAAEYDRLRAALSASGETEP